MKQFKVTINLQLPYGSIEYVRRFIWMALGQVWKLNEIGAVVEVEEVEL